MKSMPDSASDEVNAHAAAPSARNALIDALLRRPQGFNLFQAINLLERAVPKAAPVGEGDRREAGAVRLSSLVSLGFQASDIAGIAEGAPSGEAFTLTTPVLSLAGAQGPLPLPFTEMVLERKAARDHATADFLDIFNHRFLAFLYRSRRKHHVGLSRRSPEQSALASCLDALSALGLKSGVRGPQGQTEWLRHAGLMGGAPRSAAALLALLGDRLGLRARIRQFRGGWQALGARDVSRLAGSPYAQGPLLGQGAVLGRRYWNQSAGIELEFCDLTWSRLQGLLPGGKDFELTKWLTRRYVQEETDIVLALSVDRKQCPAPALGGNVPMRLGWTAWLASGKTGRPLPVARMRMIDSADADPA